VGIHDDEDNLGQTMLLNFWEKFKSFNCMLLKRWDMKTIMIVDDEIDMLKEAKSFLEKDDFEVVTATNNRDALEHMGKMNEENVNLILVNTVTFLDNKPAFFSIKPTSKMDINTSKTEDFLQKPKNYDADFLEQLRDFVNRKLEE